MGNHIALGFRETGRKAEPVLLYVGQDAGEATKVFMNPPQEIVRTEVLHHVPFTRQRTHDGSGVGYEAPVIVTPDEILPLGIADLPEDVRKEIEGAFAAKVDLEKLGEVEREICPEGMGFVQFVDALKIESAERQVLLEAANGRVTALEGENAKLLEEIKALKSGTGVFEGGNGTARPSVSPGSTHLLTEDPPAAEAPAEPEKAEGDTLKLNLPPKGGKKEK